MQNALAVGPSKVEPLYGEIFARRYRPSFGVQVWSPDVLTSYVVQVPKMVCFFEVAFDNGLCFPLHPFIKRVSAFQRLPLTTFAQFIRYSDCVVSCL